MTHRWPHIRRVESAGVPPTAPRLIAAEQAIRDEEGPAGSPERIATARRLFLERLARKKNAPPARLAVSRPWP